MRRLDLTGQSFGRLCCMEHIGQKNGHVVWRCLCNCGNMIEVRSNDLRTGKVRSCGCFHDEGNHTTHGLSRKSIGLYRVWERMKSRCYNPRSSDFKYYGGRGICVCDEWKNFENFHAWALCNGYEDGLTIERKNNNGNYKPNNCKWATMKEQGNNKRNNIKITLNGQTKTLGQWADDVGISAQCLRSRLRRGWSEDKTLRVEVRG